MTISSRSAFARICAAGALALGLGTAASAQEAAPAAPQAQPPATTFTVGTCHPTATLAAHVLEQGQSPAVYGLTHTQMPAFMLTVQGGVHSLPGRDEGNSAWTLMSVQPNRTACIVMQGESSVQQFGLVDAIEVNYTAPANDAAANIIPVNFAPIPVPMRVCNDYAAADSAIDENFGLVRVFTGAMEDGRSVVVYGPDQHKLSENGNRFMVTLESESDNMSCPVILGVGYQTAKPR